MNKVVLISLLVVGRVAYAHTPHESPAHVPFGNVDRVTGFPFSDQKLAELGKGNAVRMSAEELSAQASETPGAALERLLKLTPLASAARKGLLKLASSSQKQIDAIEKELALSVAKDYPKDFDVRTDKFLAGSAWAELTPPEIYRGCPLGGTGSRHKKIPLTSDPYWEDPANLAKWQFPSKGSLDPLRVKVLALSAPDGGRPILFINTDLVGVDDLVIRRLASRLVGWGVDRNRIIIGGTHNHSGTGTLATAPWYWFTATDFFDKRMFDFTMDRLEEASIAALSKMVPARVAMSSCEDQHKLSYNTRDNDHQLDKEIGVIQVRSVEGDVPIGVIFNFAVHVNAIRERLTSPFFSADISGVAERRIEDAMESEGKGRPVAMHFNGAEGDVNPTAKTYLMMLDDGAKLGDQVLDCHPQTPWQTHMHISLRNDPLEFPWGPYMRPGLIEEIVPLWVTIPVSGLVYKKGWLTNLVWNDAAIQTFPGEPIAHVGTHIKNIQRTHMKKQFNWVFGLTNGYVQYTTTEAEYWKGGYQAAATLFGPKQWDHIRSRVEAQVARQSGG